MRKQNLKSLKLRKRVISSIGNENVKGGVPGKPPSKQLPYSLHCQYTRDLNVCTYTTPLTGCTI